MKNRYTLIFALTIGLTSVSAQELPLLLNQFDYETPSWSEYFYFKIDAAQDTFQIASGQLIDAQMRQADHYDILGNWQGVDRFIWETEHSLRVYHYNGEEELFVWNTNKQLLERSYSYLGRELREEFEYHGERMHRISRTEGEKLEEFVFVYLGKDDRLKKVKYFLNGEHIGDLKLSYNLVGICIMEELWMSGNLEQVVTYSYDNKKLQSVSLVDLGLGKGQLRQQRNYEYFDDASFELRIVDFNLNNNTKSQEGLIIFDKQGRKIEERWEIFARQAPKEVHLYAYPSLQDPDEETLTLRSDGR